MAEEELEDGSLSRTFKDLFAGAAGGVAQVLLGQPFDIVKVRLQTTNHYSNALDGATKIWKNEGPLAFYKGTLTPLIGIGACVSVQFGAFHAARRRFEVHNASTRSSSTSSASSASASQAASSLTYTQYYLSGAIAGLSNTILSSPIEHIRIRLQTQPHTASTRLYAGPLDCIRKLAGTHGLAHGLYRGTAVTLLREAQAYGTWFLTFEWLMAADVARNNIQRKDVPTWKVAAYGGLAGEALWISSYPFDVVKSKMQSDGFGDQARYAGMRDCFRKTWAHEGARGFWKGIGPTLLRAMPVSAGTFAVVEMTMRALG